MKKLLILIMVSLLALLQVELQLNSHSVSAYYESVETDDNIIFDGDYYSIYSAWLEEDFIDNSDFEAVVMPSDFNHPDNLVSHSGYAHDVYQWDNDEAMTLNVTVPSDGLYHIAIDFYSLSSNYDDIELTIKVNQELQYIESQQIILYKLWTQSHTFPTDRYGNDFYAEQTQLFSWINQSFYDPMGLFNEALTFRLNEGVNQITLERTKGEILLGDVYITGYKEVMNYSEYSEGATLVSDEVNLSYEAEVPTYKNSSSIQPGVSRDALVTPFDVSLLKLNTLSGTSFNSEREEVSYEVNVTQSGYYHLTFKTMQNEITNGVSYRTLKINGEIPFSEAKHLEFSYSTKWQNVTLGSEDEAYLIYLEEGNNTISLSVDLSLYQESYYQIEAINDYINELALQIQKLTGNQVDEDRDWDIISYLPNVENELINASNELSKIYDYLLDLNPSNKLTEAQSSLKIAIRNIDYLLEDINQLPKNISLLTTSNESISSSLSNVVNQLLDSPLSIDKFYVHTDTLIQRAEASFFSRVWLGIKRFFLSFFDEKYNEEPGENEIVVWANRSKQYVDLMQKMADEEFTTETGIDVNISVMAAESKLILANSAGTNPDVALGVASWLPYDLGIRGAILDLTEFKDDSEFINVLNYYMDEALIPMAYNNGLYGLPDTENFYVLYYREDILSALDVSIPQTWEEVTEIMPVLKRYGLNFYIPLSSATSLKSFDSTLPFFFQNGSDIYDDSGFYVDLENEASVKALETMTELYTIYSMNTTVTSFYNDFKLGLSPIGVGDFGMYVTLLNAAPNIKGLWNIALLPGVEQTNGSIDRSSPGAQTANMIFANTDKKDESWEFLKWWSETSTQIEFSDLLLSTLGPEYLWNTANLDAFKALNINEDHQDIILEQWDYLRELPKVPGSYQVELEISNIWNAVVLERESLRVLLNDSILTMDKEIHKKMSEFDYMDKEGTILKPYILPSKSLIEQWKRGEFDE